ncbi:MAG: T9SS type A sorting domain-containing protein, partial [Candidatus Lokiarchaeota archaeon]|nr:T9SS type A sorting domain-containing protein [Candidatus Lokiarchaeota archaeon]
FDVNRYLKIEYCDLKPIDKIKFKIDWGGGTKETQEFVGFDSGGDQDFYSNDKLNTYYSCINNYYPSGIILDFPLDSKFQHIITNKNQGNDDGNYYPKGCEYGESYDIENGHLAMLILKITGFSGENEIIWGERGLFWIEKEHEEWNNNWLPEVDELTNPIPERFILHQNFPNPCNPHTKIEFDLPNYLHVELSIYNIVGQKIKTLVNDQLPPGRHSFVWDGISNNHEILSNGIYIYCITTPKFKDSKKLIFMK